MRVAVVLAVATALAAPASAADVQIKAKDIYFTPSLRVITTNDTVIWVNDGDLAHTVTSFPGAPRSFDSSPNATTCDDGNPLTQERCLEPGDRFEVTFTQPGIYDYYCKVHGTTVAEPTAPGDQAEPCGMCGRIDVRAPVTRPSPTSTPTLDREDPTPTATASPSPSPSPSDTLGPTDEPTDQATSDTPGTPAGGGGGGGGRALIAILAIAVLSGAGFLTWRRFLATG
jgi:plastocyanin